MSTPSIQTLITQAQQVLNLKSTNEIRATLAAVLANANVGTPLNPNLTTQQLWDEFYEIVRQPSDDIMSIVVDQMMRMVFSPPAPGGAGADKQVIFNDGGVLAGDTKFLWDKTANRLDVDGPVVITGDLTVDTSTFKVNSGNNNVGIGFAGNASSGRLQISQPLGSTIDGALRLTDDATTSFIFNNVSSGLSAIWSSGSIAFGVGSGTFAEAMRLNSTGLGVGATPGERLTIQTALTGTTVGSNTVGRFQSNGSGYDAHIALGDNVNPSARIGYLSSAMYFWTNGAERVRIDSSGNVGVGGSPSYKVSAIGTTDNQVVLHVGNTAGSTDGDTTNVVRFAAGSGANALWANARYDGFSHAWRCNSTTTQAMTLDASGNLLVGVASANANGGVLQLKSGITFPATQVAASDANTLDDYEEGTWLGTIGGTTTNPTTPVLATGRYTKIGRQVSVEIGFYGDTAGASGRITVSGLPFTSNAILSRPGVIAIDTMGTFTGSPIAYLAPGVTIVELLASNSNASLSNVTHNAGAGRALYMELTYTV